MTEKEDFQKRLPNYGRGFSFQTRQEIKLWQGGLQKKDEPAEKPVFSEELLQEITLFLSEGSPEDNATSEPELKP